MVEATKINWEALLIVAADGDRKMSHHKRQLKLAADLGISYPHLTCLQNGVRKPSKTLLRLIDCYLRAA